MRKLLSGGTFRLILEVGDTATDEDEVMENARDMKGHIQRDLKIFCEDHVLQLNDFTVDMVEPPEFSEDEDEDEEAEPEEAS